MKTAISVEVTKVTKETVSMEIEFPAYYKHKSLNFYHRFKAPKEKALSVYNELTGYKLESDTLYLDYILSHEDYATCTPDEFYEAYAMARYALDIKIDFEQLYLTNNLPEND